jgi:hypothetical protein
MKWRKKKYYKFELMGDEVFSMLEFSSVEYSNGFIRLKDGELRIKKYYAWDGSSVPLKKFYKWLWDSDKHCKEASLIHDSLYQVIRVLGLSEDYRKMADDIYLRKLLVTKMPDWQANMRYKALRKFGNTDRYEESPIFET